MVLYVDRPKNADSGRKKQCSFPHETPAVGSCENLQGRNTIAGWFESAEVLQLSVEGNGSEVESVVTVKAIFLTVLKFFREAGGRRLF